MMTDRLRIPCEKCTEEDAIYRNYLYYGSYYYCTHNYPHIKTCEKCKDKTIPDLYKVKMRVKNEYFCEHRLREGIKIQLTTDSDPDTGSRSTSDEIEFFFLMITVGIAAIIGCVFKSFLIAALLTIPLGILALILTNYCFNYHVNEMVQQKLNDKLEVKKYLNNEID